MRAKRWHFIACSREDRERGTGRKPTKARLFLSLLAGSAILAPWGWATSAHARPAASSPTAPAKTPATQVAAKPNVVVIVADDLGWPDVSAYGRSEVPTPNIDRIAKAGAAFSSGYVAASVCAVSRAGLLTGRMPQRFGFTYNISDKGDPGAGLPPSEPTLAERLKPLGYRTAAIGKWHVGAEDRFYPTNRGFDEFFGFLAGETVHVDPKAPDIVTTPTKADANKPPFTTRSGNGVVIEGANRLPVDNFGKYLTDEITDRAVDFIGKAADIPFFAYVAYSAPHWPLQVPQSWYDKFPHIKDPARRTYVAMIAAMDAGIGRILDKLEMEGKRENTIVIFLSDNGCPVQFGFCSEDQAWGAGKFTYLEGGIRVPFLLSWPAGLKPQGIINAPVSSVDIVPTVLRAAAPDAALPPGLDGEDLVMAARVPRATPRLLIWGQEPVFAARYGPFKYWRSHDWNEAHLYNLDTDPWERESIAADNAPLNHMLEVDVEKWRASLPAPLWNLHLTRPVTIAGRKTEWVY